MRIAVCDDEKEIRQILSEKTRGLYPKAEVCSFGSGEEFLSSGQLADILFLDIQMPGENGIEIAKRMRRQNQRTVLIFVTALKEYVFEAFDVGAFHYLVKPFDDEKFREVLLRAVEQYWQINVLVQQRKAEERYILIKAGGVRTRIFVKDIVYAEVYNRKVMIHCQDEEIEYYGRLSDLEKQLGEDFFRPHRAYLVHFRYVVQYDASRIRMGKGTALMAKQKYPEFVKRYMQYVCRKGSCLQG